VPRAGNLVGGRYQLLEEIGQGAMGSVWKAVHVTLRRPFAVKFLKPYAADADRMRERFSREARLAAAVSHRFVVDIVDHGMTDEGTPYLVMEYLQGDALDARLRRDPPLRVRELLRLIGEVLLGLAAVHRAGIVHRDVKPENILLTVEADQVVAKLVDFGISREEPSHWSARPTPIGPLPTAMGTPWYMSPEQANGRLPVDRRSDIFSAGVILYEALTGTPPFDGPDAASVMAVVAHGSVLPLDVMRADLGSELCSIVMKALAREPEQRHESAEAMAAALFAAATSVPEDLTCPPLEPVVTAPPSVAERASFRARTPSPPAASRRVTRLLVSAAALVAVTVAVYVGRPAARAKPEPPPPAPPALRAPGLGVVSVTVTPMAAGRPDERGAEESRPAKESPDPPPPRGESKRNSQRITVAPALFRSPGF
jgi:eukaryotic-like serine/threonine-protein kinase